jgi:hypothetical protein
LLVLGAQPAMSSRSVNYILTTERLIAGPADQELADIDKSSRLEV